MPSARIRVLELDRDLAGALDDDAYTRARERCTAPAMALPAGRRWSPLNLREPLVSLGLLVLRGVLVHRLRLVDRETADLVGTGDLIRPWPPSDEYGELFTASTWQVIEDAEVAALDLDFLRVASAWPELLVALVERTAWHARSLELRLAISQIPQLSIRLQIMLWHLADRFGRVDRDGVLIPLQLSRGILGQLVGVRREPVSRRLKELADRGVVMRDRRGWRLCGPPPAELAALDGTGQQAAWS
jgi:CRP/FNR family transcriptional regulator, cyclic AMP receptor protein